MIEAIVAGAIAGAVAGAIVTLTLSRAMTRRHGTWRFGGTIVSRAEHGRDGPRAPDSAPARDRPTATLTRVDARGPFDLLDDPAKRTLALAQDEAMRLRHGWIGTEHLLLGLLRGEGIAAEALEELGVTLERSRALVAAAVPPGEAPAPSEQTLTPRTKDVLSRAILVRSQQRRSAVSPTLLLLALVSDPDAIGTQVLAQQGASAEAVWAAVGRRMPPQP